MTEQPVGPRCGNNPNVRLTPGDRKAVDDFKARLALQESAKPYIASAAWVDGDPLMEVIAATLWKHCARDDRDMPQLVCDDPRTIAAFAAAVARAHAVLPPAGQTDEEDASHSVVAPHCDGFPTTCPNPVTVSPAPPHHGGGIRCGCYDEEPTS